LPTGEQNSNAPCGVGICALKTNSGKQCRAKRFPRVEFHCRSLRCGSLISDSFVRDESFSAGPVPIRPRFQNQSFLVGVPLCNRFDYSASPQSKSTETDVNVQTKVKIFLYFFTRGTDRKRRLFVEHFNTMLNKQASRCV
jgi:hypothetical protein